MAGKISPTPLSLIAVLAMLTFVVPMTRWLVGGLVASAQYVYVDLISSILIILCIFLWDGKARSFSLLPVSSSWKISCYVVGIIVFALLIINLLNQPASKITGQIRSPLEVLDVIA